MLIFELSDDQVFVKKMVASRGNSKPLTSIVNLVEKIEEESKGENMFNEFLKELGEEYEGYILEDLDRGLVKIVVRKDGRKAEVVIPYDIFMGNPVTDTAEFLCNLAKSLVDELNRG